MELTVQWLDSLGTRADGGWFIVITLITFVNGIWLKMSTDYANFAHRFSMFLLKYMPFRTICRRAWFQWRKLINCNFIKSKHTHTRVGSLLYTFSFIPNGDCVLWNCFIFISSTLFIQMDVGSCIEHILRIPSFERTEIACVCITTTDAIFVVHVFYVLHACINLG